jgi:hypothetical protein
MNGNVETRHLGAKGPFIGGRRWLLNHQQGEKETTQTEGKKNATK